MNFESDYTTEELEALYMNPFTGSVDTLQNWICDFRQIELAEDEEVSFDLALAQLVEVTRDEENDCWKEV